MRWLVGRYIFLNLRRDGGNRVSVEGKWWGRAAEFFFLKGGPDDSMHMEATIPLEGQFHLYEHTGQGDLYAEVPPSTLSLS